MTKSEKLRLYEQKDYSELIEFPVELVGKDGIVRRYTYEESLLVYQKRIESAHQRYRDTEVASAEVDHCSKRIDQIKRSWKIVAARKVASSSTDYAARFEESAAAECRAFVREYFGKALADRVATDEEPIPIYLSLVHQTGPLKVFHVSLSNRRGGHLLYAFTFGWVPEKEGEPGARAQYTDWSRILATSPGGEDVEHLLAAREGKDFGFLLTGPAGAGAPVSVPDGDSALARAAVPSRKPTGAARARIQSMIDEEPDNAEAHYAMGVLLMREGDPAGALDELKVCVELSPYYLDGYRMIASIGERLKEWESIEPYLLQARHYFPEDARIHYQLGLLELRQSRFDRAEEPLKRALELDPGNRRAGWLLEVLERCRTTGADPASALSDLPLEDSDPAKGPGNLALLGMAFAASLALAVHTQEAMAGTFLLAIVLVAMILHGARQRSPRFAT